MTDHARAILVLPSGHRAFDEDFPVAHPVPRTIDVHGTGGVFTLRHEHGPDGGGPTTHAVYILGGRYLPHGAIRDERLAPDEVHDQ